MLRGLYILFFVVSLFEIGTIYAQDSEQLLSKKGLELFNNEQFVLATPIYLQLLSLQPRSPEYNYRYGACLLFNSSDRRNAIKYLEFATANAEVDVAAFFFMGKAFHLNYQFEKAILFYQEYKVKSKGNIRKSWEVERQIQACKDGKELLKEISDIVVFEKKAVSKSTFYTAYELSGVSGNIVISEIDQTKIDKKKDHKPLIYFPSNAKRVFFGSYGNSEKTGKDIYVKEKNADGSWSKPALVRGAVNSDFDEDFAFMDEQNGYLYFSSKGHNSMGGYDIFKSKYDPTTNSFEKPENLDFAISSTDDDLLYIPDDSNEFAWFASSRQSKDGKIDVYKVKVERVSAPIAAVQGTFNSLIHPENKKLSIEVKDLSSNKDIGIFYTDDFGSYIIHFPKSGPYEFSIRIFGTPEPFTKIIEIPTNAEMYLFKQQLIHFEKTGKEYVDLINTESEDLYSDATILAEITNSKAELNPNAGLFENVNTENSPEIERVLTELSMNKLSPFEVAGKTSELVAVQKNEYTQNRTLQQKSFQIISNNNQQIIALQSEVKNVVAKTHGVIEESEKQVLLNQAAEKIERITALEQENKQLLIFADSIQNLISELSISENKLKEIEDQLKRAQSIDDAAIFDVVSKNIAVIRDLQQKSKELKNNSLPTEIVVLTQEDQKNKKIIQSYQFNANSLKNEIQLLEEQKMTSKLKKQEQIQIAIDAKKNDLNLIENEISDIQEKDIQNTTVLNAKKEQLYFVQRVEKEPIPLTNRTESMVEKEMKLTDNQNFRTLKSYVNQQLEKKFSSDISENLTTEVDENLELKKETYTDENIQDEIIENQQESKQNKEVEIKEVLNYKNERAQIESNSKLKVEQKEEAILRSEIELQKNLLLAIQKVQADLIENPSDEEKQNRLEVLEAEKEISENRESEQFQILVAREVTKIDSAKLLFKLDPSYVRDIQKIKKSKSENQSTELIQREVQVQKQLNAQLEMNQTRLNASNSVLITAENQVISNLIHASEERIEVLQNQLDIAIEKASENSNEQQEYSQIGEFRTKSLAENSDYLTRSFDTEIALKEQAKVISDYQKIVENRLVELKMVAKTNSNPEVQTEMDWTIEELELVENKLGAISIELNKVEEKKVALQKVELENSVKNDATSEGVEDSFSSVENMDVEKTMEAVITAIQKNQKTISALKENTSETAKNRLKNMEFSIEKLEQEAQEISKVKDEEIKVKLLTKIVQQQFMFREQLVEIAREDLYIQVVELPNNMNDLKVNELESTSKLEAKQRRFQFEIRELTSSIEELDLRIEKLNKRKSKDLIIERNEKQALLASNKSDLRELEGDLASRTKAIPELINTTLALKVNVDFKTENHIAQTSEYKQIQTQYKEISNLNAQIKKNLGEIELKRKEIEMSISESQALEIELDEMYISEKLNEINTLIKSIEKTENKRNELQDEFIVSLSNSRNSEVIQNLLIRGVTSISTTQNKVNNVVLKEFKILSPKENSIRPKIILNEDKPTGLLYRVQVGAFSKPINETLFSEFTPVSGEKLNNGITRYMVGYFNKREAVMSALAKVRKIGYADAFPVAYCDGERISMFEAKRLQDAGLCLPQGSNELEIALEDVSTELINPKEEKLNQTKNVLVESNKAEAVKSEMIQTKTEQRNSLIVQKEVEQEVLSAENTKLAAYNKAPGAAIAYAVETRLGLFFTVQIGVYNKPVPASQLLNIKPLVTQRLENGQVRYSSGIFHSVSEAKPKRDEAVLLGISDAYITAYYQGKRISVQEARALLQEKGESILEPIKVLENKTLTEKELDAVETNKIKAEEVKIENSRANVTTSKHKIQFVSKKQFDRFPMDVLKRYNQKGEFYYDSKDLRVKSIVYNASSLPAIYGFKDDVDTLIVRTKTRQEIAEELILKVEIKETSLPGNVGDWLLRFGYLRELKVLEDRIQLTVFGITDAIDYEFLVNELKSLGFETISEMKD